MFRKLFAIALVAGLVPAAAHSATSYGPRFGVSLDPDQLVFGGQLVVAEVAPNLAFVPNLELGFGDDVTVISLNGDMLYHFALQGTDWTPYAGLGVGVNWISVDLPAPAGDNSDTEVGLNVVLGTEVPTKRGNAFFAELRFGVGDIPEIKIIAGWNFKMK
jgi:hypothetical protein